MQITKRQIKLVVLIVAFLAGFLFVNSQAHAVVKNIANATKMQGLFMPINKKASSVTVISNTVSGGGKMFSSTIGAMDAPAYAPQTTTNNKVWNAMTDTQKSVFKFGRNTNTATQIQIANNVYSFSFPQSIGTQTLTGSVVIEYNVTGNGYIYAGKPVAKIRATISGIYINNEKNRWTGIDNALVKDPATAEAFSEKEIFFSDNFATGLWYKNVRADYTIDFYNAAGTKIVANASDEVTNYINFQSLNTYFMNADGKARSQYTNGWMSWNWHRETVQTDNALSTYLNAQTTMAQSSDGTIAAPSNNAGGRYNPEYGGTPPSNWDQVFVSSRNIGAAMVDYSASAIKFRFGTFMMSTNEGLTKDGKERLLAQGMIDRGYSLGQVVSGVKFVASDEGATETAKYSTSAAGYLKLSAGTEDTTMFSDAWVGFTTNTIGNIKTSSPVKATVKYKYADGTKAANDNLQTIRYSGTQAYDEATYSNKITYTANATDLAAYTRAVVSPVIAGYVASNVTINLAARNATYNDTLPADQEIVVTYTKVDVQANDQLQRFEEYGTNPDVSNAGESIADTNMPQGSNGVYTYRLKLPAIYHSGTETYDTRSRISTAIEGVGKAFNTNWALSSVKVYATGMTSTGAVDTTTAQNITGSSGVTVTEAPTSDTQIDFIVAFSTTYLETIKSTDKWLIIRVPYKVDVIQGADVNETHTSNVALSATTIGSIVSEYGLTKLTQSHTASWQPVITAQTSSDGTTPSNGNGVTTAGDYTNFEATAWLFGGSDNNAKVGEIGENIVKFTFPQTYTLPEKSAIKLIRITNNQPFGMFGILSFSPGENVDVTSIYGTDINIDSSAGNHVVTVCLEQKSLGVPGSLTSSNRANNQYKIVIPGVKTGIATDKQNKLNETPVKVSQQWRSGASSHAWNAGVINGPDIEAYTRIDPATAYISQHNNPSKVITDKSVQSGTWMDYHVTQQLGDTSKNMFEPIKSIYFMIYGPGEGEFGSFKIQDETGRDVTSNFSIENQYTYAYRVTASKEFLERTTWSGSGGAVGDTNYRGHQYTVTMPFRLPDGDSELPALNPNQNSGSNSSIDTSVYINGLSYSPRTYYKTPIEVPEKHIYDANMTANDLGSIRFNFSDKPVPINDTIIPLKSDFKYVISQRIAQESGDTGYDYGIVKIEDSIPNPVIVKDVQIYVYVRGAEEVNITNQFTNNTQGKKLSYTMNQSFLDEINKEGSKYTGAMYYMIISASTPDSVPSEQVVTNQASWQTRDVTDKEYDEIKLTNAVKFWLMPSPEKTFTTIPYHGDAQTDVTEATLDSPITHYNYKINQRLPLSDTFVPLNSFVLKDKIDDKVVLSSWDICQDYGLGPLTSRKNSFDYTIENNVVTLAANAEFLQDRNNYGHTYTLVLRVTPKGENTKQETIKNTAETDVSVPGFGSKTLTSNTTSTTIPPINTSCVKTYVRTASETDWSKKATLKTFDELYDWKVDYHLPNNKRFGVLFELRNLVESLQSLGNFQVSVNPPIPDALAWNTTLVSVASPTQQWQIAKPATPNTISILTGITSPENEATISIVIKDCSLATVDPEKLNEYATSASGPVIPDQGFLNYKYIDTWEVLSDEVLVEGDIAKLHMPEVKGEGDKFVNATQSNR